MADYPKPTSLKLFLLLGTILMIYVLFIAPFAIGSYKVLTGNSLSKYYDLIYNKVSNTLKSR